MQEDETKVVPAAIHYQELAAARNDCSASQLLETFGQESTGEAYTKAALAILNASLSVLGPHARGTAQNMMFDLVRLWAKKPQPVKTRHFVDRNEQVFLVRFDALALMGTGGEGCEESKRIFDEYAPGWRGGITQAFRSDRPVALYWGQIWKQRPGLIDVLLCARDMKPDVLRRSASDLLRATRMASWWMTETEKRQIARGLLSTPIPADAKLSGVSNAGGLLEALWREASTNPVAAMWYRGLICRKSHHAPGGRRCVAMGPEL